jgi:hypothetical protein
MPLNGVAIAWTGYSPTLGPVAANVGANSGQLQFGNPSIDYRLENTLRRPQLRPFTRALRSIVVSGVGTPAVATRERVKGTQAYLDPSALGGLVQMELQTLINRNTTVADQNFILSVIDELTAPLVYPTDPSGNSGGGKLGF